MKDNIILIGFMGAGKTSIGIYFAGKTGIRFIDTDQLIEETAGMSIPHIFENQGEDSFRQQETEVLKALLTQKDRAVISVGGGLPLREENRKLLKELGTVIFLKVKPDTVMERLKGDTSRPLLWGEGGQARVENLLDFRNPIYEAAAHYVIDTDGKSLDWLAEEIDKISRR